MKKYFVILALSAFLISPQAAMATPEGAAPANEMEFQYYDDETGITQEERKLIRKYREKVRQELESLPPAARMERMKELRDKIHGRVGVIDWRKELDEYESR